MKNPFRHLWFCVAAVLIGMLAATALVCGGFVLLAQGTAGFEAFDDESRARQRPEPSEGPGR